MFKAQKWIRYIDRYILFENSDDSFSSIAKLSLFHLIRSYIWTICFWIAFRCVLRKKNIAIAPKTTYSEQSSKSGGNIWVYYVYINIWYTQAILMSLCHFTSSHSFRFLIRSVTTEGFICFFIWCAWHVHRQCQSSFGKIIPNIRPIDTRKNIEKFDCVK